MLKLGKPVPQRLSLHTHVLPGCCCPPRSVPSLPRLPRPSSKKPGISVPFIFSFLQTPLESQGTKAPRCQAMTSEVTMPATAWDSFHQPQVTFSFLLTKELSPRLTLNQFNRPNKKKRTINHHLMPGINALNPPRHHLLPQPGGSSASQGGPRSCGSQPCQREAMGQAWSGGAARSTGLPSTGTQPSAASGPCRAPGRCCLENQPWEQELFIRYLSKRRRCWVRETLQDWDRLFKQLKSPGPHPSGQEAGIMLQGLGFQGDPLTGPVLCPQTYVGSSVWVTPPEGEGSGGARHHLPRPSGQLQSWLWAPLAWDHPVMPTEERPLPSPVRCWVRGPSRGC
ncbi:uncharacterized protein LOC129735902 [Falco cherrug]|uniref:uncharacterized protein LOC129735902 n=1 Tax=Falco cherrug TaxID=345164 RepID=UPI00247AC19D|nr:uncharacterized protein LOC129735902 [Falco cherrug]